MWSEGCICCSSDTVQQPSARKVLAGTPPRSPTDVTYVKCQNCSSKVCNFCARGLLQVLDTSNKEFPPDDPSFSALKSMAAALNTTDYPQVDFGFCCSFKQSIPSCTKGTFVTPPRAPEVSKEESSDSEFVFLNNESASKKCRRVIKNQKNNDSSTVSFLSAYFQDDAPPASMKPANTFEILGLLNKSRKKSRRPRYNMNNFQGALVFPPFGILVKGDATNHHFNCDHMALAESSEDSTKAIMHGVISDRNAKTIQDYADLKRKILRPIACDKERVVLKVRSPEDLNKTMNVVVDVFFVKQVKKCSEFQNWKGDTDFDPEFITDLQIFGQSDIASDCNVTIILGEFTLEDDAKAPKLLLLRPSGMLCNDVYTKTQRDAFAADIYNHVRSLAGKRGFEIRRTCGSSGKVSHETDKDLLRFLCHHEAVLPRFAHGCVIIRAEDRYLFCYAKATPASENKFVKWSYCPPKPGGSFDMPNSCISMFPPIAEMIYLKAFSVSVIVSLNNYFQDCNKHPVATGPLKFELASLESARTVFKKSHPDEAMYNFLCCFNSFNHYSMVAYPVGMHYDHFRHGKESLENKMLFCLKPNFGGGVGRGGCLVGTSYVYGLLDW